MKETLLALSLVAGSNIADYHTTRVGLNRPGNYEMNGLIGSRGERLELVKCLATVAEMTIFLEIKKRNKKAAWVFVVGIVATNIAVSINNHGK